MRREGQEEKEQGRDGLGQEEESGTRVNEWGRWELC